MREYGGGERKEPCNAGRVKLIKLEGSNPPSSLSISWERRAAARYNPTQGK